MMNKPMMMNRSGGEAVLCSDLVSHLHWTHGGTALTNFDPKELPKYLEAIKAHGDENMVVVLAPMDWRGVIPTDFSLHCLNMQTKRDCSEFWETYRKVANAELRHAADNEQQKETR